MATTLAEILTSLPARQQEAAMALLEEYPELTGRLESLLLARGAAAARGDWAAVESNVQAGHGLVFGLLDEAGKDLAAKLIDETVTGQGT